ncbi:unnamed protein product [Paramecium pentaurelia]|uniref:MORN repeat protein n=1 Tax=Paramecium pentaurelia TaxID=43138 RepID=A0A8S1SCY2_9CILI|nr:unnamed protein product [Paramecium pentaurelia]
MIAKQKQLDLMFIENYCDLLNKYTTILFIYDTLLIIDIDIYKIFTFLEVWDHSAIIEYVVVVATSSQKSTSKSIQKNKMATIIQKYWRAYFVRKKLIYQKIIESIPQKSINTHEIVHQEQFESGISINQDEFQRETRQPYQFKGGAVYKGEWKGQARDGIGIQVWPDGAKYEGEWKHNKAQGKGKFTHSNGDTFDGDWENDMANGYGTYQHIDGAKYEGQWFNDKQHGYGYEVWPDGSSYQGFFQNSFKHGKGKYIWPTGQYYEGDWVYNKLCGYGVLVWPDGRKYEGEFQNNNMHGKGTYTWPDGRKYYGQYFNDQKHGYGIYEWNDGRRYEGEWEHGKQHGKGLYIVGELERTGQWLNGKRIKWDDEKKTHYKK